MDYFRDEQVDLTEDILGPDSDIEMDSDHSGDESSGEDEGPNFEMKWKRNDTTNNFVPAGSEFHDSTTRFNEFSPPINTQSPLEILKTFLDDRIIENILTETNRYASQIKAKSPKALLSWTPVTEEELWSFLGLMLLTGLIKKPSYKDYWTTNPMLETPIFLKTMSRTRFENILRSFHLADNGDTSAAHINKRLWKFGSFLPELLRNFESSINVGEYLCVDESLVLFKGRLSFKQYLPLKRSRFGIKYFALVDCDSKFLVRLRVYLGKSSQVNENAKKDFGVGGAVVMGLLDGFYYSNHKVVLDNWFNSPRLMVCLHRMKTYAIGTVRKNRKGLPKNISKKLPKGGVEAFYTENLLFERWHDRREVMMLNSFITHGMEDSLSTNPRNHRLKPKSVLVYNKKMGGVDYIDQQLAPYESLRKSIKWYKKLAFHFIDLAVYNTYVMFNYLNPTSKTKYKQFLTGLIEEILAKYKVQRKAVGRPPKSSPIIYCSETTHWPQKNLKENGKSKNSDCVFCKIGGKRKATHYSCETCRKNLCIDGTNSCFKQFHRKMGNDDSQTNMVNCSPDLDSQLFSDTLIDNSSHSLDSFFTQSHSQN